jgi:hypothetical protein
METQFDPGQRCLGGSAIGLAHFFHVVTKQPCKKHQATNPKDNADDV